MSISLQELDAQFSELLPEREALGRMSFSFAHDVPCHPHHHHHHHCEPKPKCEPKPCEPKPCDPQPCATQPAPCPPPTHHVPCDDKNWHDGGNNWHDGDPKRRPRWLR